MPGELDLLFCRVLLREAEDYAGYPVRGVRQAEGAHLSAHVLKRLGVVQQLADQAEQAVGGELRLQQELGAAGLGEDAGVLLLVVVRDVRP